MKKIFSALICLSLLMTGIPYFNPSVAAAEFSGEGAGTAGAPYIITSVAQFAEINGTDSVYELRANITVTEPVDEFSGTLIGALGGEAGVMPTITLNINQSGTSGNHIGLIRKMTKGEISYIKTTGLVVSTGTGVLGTAALVGYHDTSMLKISNCVNEANVRKESSGTSGSVGAGAFVGFDSTANQLEIKNCINYGDISVSGANGLVGGLVGVLKGKIDDCVNYGAVLNTALAASGTTINAGGIAGNNTGYINMCANLGAVSATENAGGIAGVFGTGSRSVKKSYNSGTVSAGINAGGIIGRTGAACTISDSFNTGAVLNGTSKGGIIGNVAAAAQTITQAYDAQGGIAINPIGSLAVALNASSENIYYLWDGTSGNTDFTGTGILSGTLSSALPSGFNSSIWAQGTGAYTYPVIQGVDYGKMTDLNINILGTQDGYTISWDTVAGQGDYSLYLSDKLIKNDISTTSYTVLNEALELGQSYKIKIVKDSVVSVSGLSTNFGGGAGTEINPFLISTPRHLENIKLNPDAWFSQTDDIDTPVTEPIAEFSGIYDGNGYYIELAINKSNDTGVGLFSKISGGTVKNVVTKGLVTGDARIGGIVGVAETGKIVIEDCVNEATITGREAAAGIAGRIYGNNVASGTIISNCVNKGAVTITGSYVAGIVATADELLSVVSCANTADITANQIVGGIVGNGFGSIEKCYNLGALTALSSASFVSGISGELNEGGAITDCYNLGEFKRGTSSGIANAKSGTTNISVTNCYNTAVANNPITSSQANTLDKCYYLSAKGEIDAFTGTTAVDLSGLPSIDLGSAFTVDGTSAIYKYPQITGNLQEVTWDFVLLTLTITGSENGVVSQNESSYLKMGAPYTVTAEPNDGYTMTISYQGTPMYENELIERTLSIPSVDQSSVVLISFDERAVTDESNLAVIVPLTIFIPQISAEETIINQDGSFTVYPGRKYGVTLSQTSDYYGWTIEERGVELDGTLYPSLIYDDNEKYGILFEGLSAGDYTVRTYVRYENEAQSVIKYGDADVITIQ